MPSQLEVCAEVLATPAEQKEIEAIVCRISLEKVSVQLIENCF